MWNVLAYHCETQGIHMKSYYSKYRNKLIPALLSIEKKKKNKQQKTITKKPITPNNRPILKKQTSSSMRESCFCPCNSVAMGFGSQRAQGAVCRVAVFTALKTRLQILSSLFDTLVNYISWVIELVLHNHSANNSGSQPFLILTWSFMCFLWFWILTKMY